MNIAGLERTSFVDWPGRIAAVVFTPGCNLDCFYCHNSQLAHESAQNARIAQNTVLEWLATRAGLLDGIVITGGEPTLQRDLPGFIQKVRSIGYPVKLDTNGTRPAVLRALLEQNILDYVAMDVKAPQQRYEAFCGVPVDARDINASIDLLLHSSVEYEFRTTVAPQLSAEDVLAVARRVKGAKRYVLQQFRPPRHLDDAADPRLAQTPHPPNRGLAILPQIQPLVERCETRGFAGFDTSAQFAVGTTS